ncbi:uncharacterized protein LOC111392252 [Olea europaea var. sylvestris]|uniref:uncharacterized protein LOC111392252 n=1 Tax=Olea europaea var. sylvestris TaxID=158386 RepID=UPI000C1CD132|nr:uncharacterized protein LOC111392252 [Olea europaea var. sylvestris]XP_022873311.1 uncharacterized protein LOC111392252 [Olea europaea var. sylvestris]XP_022873312.1 uncharacterized protein LOC111392252 [Olea europaea var. sylvestris]
MVGSKSIGDPLFTTESQPAGEHFENSDTKRPMPQCLPTSPDHQSPKSTSGNGHIVYVRRKAETEFGKTSSCVNQNDAIVCPHGRKSNDQGKTTQQNPEMKEPATFISNSPSIQTVSASGLSVKHCVSPSHGKSNNISSPANISYVHVNSANSLLDNPKRVNVKHWEERYCQLQNLLTIVDQPDQDDYVQMLRSLSSVELSRHAVELEKRSIQLSLEEAKEMQRVHLFDVLGKHTKNLRASSVE